MPAKLNPILSEGLGTYPGTGALPGAGAIPPGTLPGATQPGVGAYGTVPRMPNPITTAGATTTGNLANLSGIGSLATSYDQLTNAGALGALTSNLPGYGKMVGTSSGNILSNLQGQIPQDVLAQLGQFGAEHGVSMGAPGAPASQAALMRALYETSTGLQQKGEQELTSAVARTPVGKQFDPASMFVTPGQSQEAQYMANLLASAPDPWQAAAAAQAAALAGAKSGGGLIPGGIPAPPPPPPAPGTAPGATTNLPGYPNSPALSGGGGGGAGMPGLGAGPTEADMWNLLEGTGGAGATNPWAEGNAAILQNILNGQATQGANTGATEADMWNMADYYGP